MAMISVKNPRTSEMVNIMYCRKKFCL